jgi:YD repeat-containing protein
LEFDNRFQLASLVGPSGERYEYSYDSRGNLVGFVDPLRNVVSFTYDPIFNQLTGFTDARGNGIQYAYDAHGDLERITYEDDSNEVFTYYDDGNVKTWTNRRGQTVAYAYNAAGQLTSKDYTRDYAGPRLLSIRRAALEFPDDAFQTFADHSAAGAGSP